MPPAPAWPDLYPVAFSLCGSVYCLDETSAKNLLKNKALVDGYHRDVELIWEKEKSR